jgi:hypothetical protein
MQEQHEALREAHVCNMVAKKTGDDEEQTFNIVMANKDARAAGEGQIDNKTEEIEQKMTLDTEVMGDDWSKVSTDYDNNAKTPLIAAADIETKKIESMKCKDTRQSLKVGDVKRPKMVDVKVIEHPKKERKRLSAKSKAGGAYRSKRGSVVGSYRKHNKVAANTHPPHPDMTATLIARKDKVRHNLQIRGSIPA